MPSRLGLSVAACLLSGALLPSGGCAWLPRTSGDYHTIEASPLRDLERAEELHATAIRRLAEGDLDGAERRLREALQADVSFGAAHNALGKVFYLQHRYYLAAWEFEYALRLMPDRAAPVNNLGLVYEAVGRWEEAIEHYRMAIAMDPSAVAYLSNLARVKMRRGDRDAETEYLLRQVVSLDDRPGWRDWAQLQLAHESFDEAIEDLGPPSFDGSAPTLPLPDEGHYDLPTDDDLGLSAIGASTRS